jgi:hypothetical protein
MLLKAEEEPLADTQSKRPGRITVVGSVYHQPPEGPPSEVGKPFSVKVSSSEQPYVRRLTVGPDLQPLDCGWLAGGEIARLVVENHEPPGGAAVLLALRDGAVPFMLVRPGSWESFEPVDPDGLRLKAGLGGAARVTITLYPA